MSQHIGIVACSSEGAALCYRTICMEGAAASGAHAHPEVSIHTLPLSQYVTYLEHGDIAGVGELMLTSANKLASTGADFLICPDNTIHEALPFIQSRLPTPWLHIAEVVAAEARHRGFLRVGLTGTQWLVQSAVYPNSLSAQNIDCVLPTNAERREMNDLIMQELVNGVFTAHQVEFFQTMIGRMKNESCDAVVLGCTEIPLVMNDLNSPLPTLDSTRLLARAALARAMA